MDETTLHLFFQGPNYFGRHGGERARPLYTLNIYFFEVVITLGITEVRGPDHTQLLFFGGRNYFGRDCGERARPLITDNQEEFQHDESLAHNFSKTIHFVFTIIFQTLSLSILIT